MRGREEGRRKFWGVFDVYVREIELPHWDTWNMGRFGRLGFGKGPGSTTREVNGRMDERKYILMEYCIGCRITSRTSYGGIMVCFTSGFEEKQQQCIYRTRTRLGAALSGNVETVQILIGKQD